MPDPVAESRGLAHDAGNLLGALGLYCELLALPGVLQQEHRHYAEELRLLSHRSRTLIDRLLSVETTSRRAPEPAPETVLLPEVIDGCRGVLEAVARRALTVVYEPDAALPVRVPRESLERILVNLTKNAAEAMPEGAGPVITIRVSCRRDDPGTGDGWVVLSVEDSGRGMSTAAVRSLLGQTARAPRPDGHGIGFQVVRELAGASGGRLHLTSRIGDGTTVSIAWAIAAAANERSCQLGSQWIGDARTGGLSC
ncbi:MAG TPA: HAMP domain-containing sensor histidine kinase [Granulicella sp.]